MGRVSEFCRRNSITLALEPKREMLALDKEFSDMEAEIERLEKQNKRLQAEVNPLQREVEGLKQKIQRESAPQRSLSQAQESVLRMLNEWPDRFIEEVAELLQVSVEGAKFHIESLQEMEMVKWTLARSHSTPSWGLAQAGREYLHGKGWLK